MKSKPESISPEKTQYHAEILANRVRARFRHLSRRFRKQGIDCFRLYDWDIPEVRAIVDWYAGHLVIAEYVRWQTSPQWLPQIAKTVAQALGVPPEKTHTRRRRTNTKEGPRYGKMDSKEQRFEVHERNLRFWVNLDDYLDTGLFSDHRDTRVIMQKLAAGKDFLNLYGYTGAFTCAAAAGGAKTTVTVDRSLTYLNWARDNLKLNNLWDPRHSLIQSDVTKYLEETRRKGHQFTLAFIDPPSFFKDRNHEISFDINHDHPELILNVLKVMKPRATVFFSTNHQRFEPHLEDLPIKNLTELTPKTIPEDYRGAPRAIDRSNESFLPMGQNPARPAEKRDWMQGNRRIHRCWKMENNY